MQDNLRACACAHQLIHAVHTRTAWSANMPVACQNRWTLTRTTRARRSRVDASDCLDLLLPQSISVFAFDFSGSSPHPQTLKVTQSLPHAIPPKCVCTQFNSPVASSHPPVTQCPAPINNQRHGKDCGEGIASYICVVCMQQLHTRLPRTHGCTHAGRTMLEENRRECNSMNA